MHRLNRAEYANAIRDLLALEVDTSALLPPDDSADGFDNNADLLGVSPALLERYLSAAARISELAVNSPAIVPGSETYRIRGDASQSEQNDELSPGTRGGLLATHTFPLDGEYVIKVKLLQTNLASVRGLEYEHQFEITLDGERVLLAPVGGPDQYVRSGLNATEVANEIEARLQVRVKAQGWPARGRRGLPAASSGLRRQPPAAVSADDAHRDRPPRLPARGEHDGVGAIQSGAGERDAEPAAGVHLSPVGPAEAGRHGTRLAAKAGLPAGLHDDERACATRIVSTLARRAYRRDVTDADLAGPLSFYEQGRTEAGFERGIELALRAILVSPKFVFRVERDPSPRLRRGKPARCIASATSSWRRGCPSSSGAASRTTTC